MTENSQRRKKHQRQIPPPSIRMTDRDAQVLEAVYHYRVMSQAHIHRLLFTDKNPNVAQRRLFLLYHNGYLDRRFLPRIGGIVTSPVLYLLDKLGSEYLIRQCGYDEIRWQSSDNKVGYEYLEHLLAINTFRVEVAVACRESGYRLLTWQDDTTLKQDYDRVTVAGITKSVAVIPDGYFVIVTPDGASPLFLELDRGTMTSKRYKQKIAAYLAYARSDLCEKRFGTRKFRVLTVTESQQRAVNLKRATEGMGGQRRFWFGVLSEMTSDAVLTAPVWKVAGSDQAVTLLQMEK